MLLPLQGLTKEKEEAIGKMAELHGENQTIMETKQNLKNKHAELLSKFEDMGRKFKRDRIAQFVNGHNICLAQVAHIIPGAYLSKVGWWKSVKNGVLVGESDTEEEEEEEDDEDGEQDNQRNREGNPEDDDHARQASDDEDPPLA